MATLAENRYPDGMPGLLSMSEFSTLLGVSRPTALSIVKRHPEYTVPRGRTRWVGVGLYYLLTRDDYMFEEVSADEPAAAL